MANAKYYGTGRRKKSIARVYLVPGTGKITINKRDIDEYLGLETLKVVVRQPLVATETVDKFDVIVNVCGGGYTGQAGAIDQLAVWAERVGVDIVKGKEGGDPSAVVFDALNKAKETGADVLICDTAGRLQNKVNLMNELEKMNRIIKRVVPEGPHETLLVVDATTGQNGVSQAIEFSKITDITGIVLTKMDGTAKGGIVLSIKDQLNIPVKFIGLGEQVDDLQEFDLEQYIYGLCKGLVEEAIW